VFTLGIFTQLTASGKSGQAGHRVLSVVVMEKGQGHDHVLTLRLRMVANRVLGSKQNRYHVMRNHVQVRFLKEYNLHKTLIIPNKFNAVLAEFGYTLLMRLISIV